VDLEVIVNDGGSTDGSVEVLKNRSEKFKWSSARDEGQTAAINLGLRDASGEILAYLNSDDVYLPGALAAVVSFFESHPECQVVFGDAYHLRADGSVLEDYPTEDWDYQRLLKVCFLCQPAVFWRRTVMERYGAFDERLSFAMDYEYWLRLGAHVPFARMSGIHLAGSRLHDETKTLGQRVRVHREIVQVIQRYSTTPGPVIHWLKNLASIAATEHGFPCSQEPVRQLQHVRRFAASALAYAEELQIRLPAEFVAELTQMLDAAERQIA